MIHPKIETLMKKVDSRYTLVILAAKRARQINSYYSQLGEGIRDFVPPQVSSSRLGEHAKSLSIALEEVAEGKFGYERPAEAEARVK
ncbi:MAG: DNA-directed polymerase, omega subunit [Actinobacteria bacterium]|nr:DNA-directed polymerase, omega subunit [Actinomycetota bacterium]MEA2504667.1 DNA-directed polymerase subunit omega [Actinomycetota bacterium]MEA2564984.1 DNA-directed polymerase subunit omega [Actinomycetota bacterium]MEA2591866.1 DNA-directed polymerase subunit omega [Actinomycetota bacterium]